MSNARERKAAGIAAAWLIVAASGTAGAATWEHAVDVDEMDDSTSCIVRPAGAFGPYFWIHYSVEGVAATVVGDTYPGREITARVDSNTALSGREFIQGAHLQQLATQLRAGGSSLKVRFIEWPSGAPETLHYDVDNIAVEMDACKAAISHQ